MALKTSNMRLADGGGTSAPKKNWLTQNYNTYKTMTPVAKVTSTQQNRYVANTPANKGVTVTSVNRSNGGSSSGSSGYSGSTLSNQPVANSASPIQESTSPTQESASSANHGIQNATSYQDYLQKIFANAQNAYNNNLNSINSMYGERLNALNSRYNSGRDTLSATNAQQQEALRKAKEQAQRQAYIQSQVAERDMQQNLSAQGLSGGASETTLASMRNNYASNRNSNEEEYLNNAASLNAAYQSELANLENQYQQLIDALNAEKANALIQNENALANAGTATINQFADYAYNMDYLNANAALQQQGQKELAAINQQYALDQMEQEQKNKINLMQTEYGLKQSLKNNNGNIKLSDIRAKLISEKRRQGYSEDEIDKLLKQYNL